MNTLEKRARELIYLDNLPNNLQWRQDYLRFWLKGNGTAQMALKCAEQLEGYACIIPQTQT